MAVISHFIVRNHKNIQFNKSITDGIDFVSIIIYGTLYRILKENNLKHPY